MARKAVDQVRIVSEKISGAIAARRDVFLHRLNFVHRAVGRSEARLLDVVLRQPELVVESLGFF